jgi:hypothetical protein
MRALSVRSCISLLSVFRKSCLSTIAATAMTLRTPQEINDMWFDPDRSKLNDPKVIQSLNGKWFMRTVPEVETRFTAESDQIERLASAATELEPMWFTPEGITLMRQWQ